jgi:uncharacterized protein HemX
MGNTIFEAVEHDMRHGWDHLTSHHSHEAVTMQPASAATPEATVSIVNTLEADGEEVLAHVTDYFRNKVPAATADLKEVEALAGTAVAQALPRLAQALAGIAHVPAGAVTSLLVPAFEALVPVIEGLGRLYPKPEAAAPAAVDAQADPAMGDTQPEPAATM